MILLLHVVISPAFAEVKTFEKKYTYRASGLDNEASSKAIGRAQAEGLLYSDLGNYLIEHTEAKLFLLGPREIRTLASALVRAETVSESKDGKSFTFTAKVATDPTALVKALNSLRKDSQRSNDLVEIGRELEAALIKIDDLRKKLSSKGADASGEKQYRRAVDDLIAWNLCLEGYRLLISDNDREAAEAFTKAIELRKEEKFFYLCRERILEKIGEYQKAKGDLDRLMELSPGKMPCTSNAPLSRRKWEIWIRRWRIAQGLSKSTPDLPRPTISGEGSMRKPATFPLPSMIITVLSKRMRNIRRQKQALNRLTRNWEREIRPKSTMTVSSHVIRNR